FLGGHALGERGLRAAARIAARADCHVFHETFPARMERGGGIPAFERFPYFPEQGFAAFGGMRHVVLAGARAPVAFFGYSGQPSRLVPDSCEVTTLAAVGEDVEHALE